MKDKSFEITPMGNQAILIRFPSIINEKALVTMLYFKRALKKMFVKGTVEIINTYSSLLVVYMEPIENIYSDVEAIKRMIVFNALEKKIKSHLFMIPVCYEEEFAWDREVLMTEKKISWNEIVQLHTYPLYTVYFIGFLPGFLYLGGLMHSLEIPRRAQPRLKVPKGAVGIGGFQTGIYPKTSPGGWQIIGNSPVSLFHINSYPPCDFKAGDKVKFFPVSKSEYEQIKQADARGQYQIKKMKL